MMMIRILRWLDDEAEKINEKGGGLPIQFLILELSRELHQIHTYIHIELVVYMYIYIRSQDH